MDHVEYDFMAGMDEETVARRLRAHDVGVLALASDGDAYAFPVNYEFLGGSLYVRLAREDESRKFEFLDGTREACFVVHGVSGDAAWSIIATGPLRALSGDAAAMFDDAVVNEAFGPLHLFDQSVDEVAVTVYELDVRIVTGREL